MSHRSTSPPRSVEQHAGAFVGGEREHAVGRVPRASPRTASRSSRPAAPGSDRHRDDAELERRSRRRCRRSRRCSRRQRAARRPTAPTGPSRPSHRRAARADRQVRRGLVLGEEEELDPAGDQDDEPARRRRAAAGCGSSPSARCRDPAVQPARPFSRHRRIRWPPRSCRRGSCTG